MNSKVNYRPDIDGLRAIAVLAVVFYHAGIPGFSGGYVGVDIFFVISGYLITTIIVREIEANDFSVLKFYERRIRRIYPAFYILTIFILLITAIFYAPDNFMAVGQSTIATTLFASNILFWSESGYFDAPSTLKPMLHTWSLAVEEQFYILFPLLVLIIMRFNRRWLKPALGLLALISFGFSMYYVRQDTSAALYLTQLRAWELLTGSLLSINTIPADIPSKYRDLLSVGGIIMIISSIFLYTTDTLFPGEAALLPVLGAASIVYSGIGGDNLVGNLLKNKPLVFIGKISYSLYLWHWVIIVFGKYYVIREPTPIEMFTWLAISFIVAVLSWKFIENPFRSKENFSQKSIFTFAGSAMAVTLALSALIYFSGGLPQRFNQQQLTAIEQPDANWKKWEACNVNLDQLSLNRLNLCTLGQADIAPAFIVWGDSHARTIASSIDVSAQKKGVSGYLAATNSCPPLLGVDNENHHWYCLEANNNVFKYVQEHPELQTVILAARWSWFATKKGYKLEGDTRVALIDINVPRSKQNENAEVFKTGLTRTVKKLLALNRKVVIVTQIPEVGYNVPSAYFIAKHTGRDVNTIISSTYQEFTERNLIFTATVDTLKSLNNVQIISPSELLCDKNICRVIADGGQPLYEDGNHLSIFGAQYISSLFDPVLDSLTTR